MFHSTWGHAITDNIRRLWFLKSDDFKNQFANCPLVYLICTKLKVFTLESYKSFRRLLELLEVDVDRLRLIEEPTQFEKIILPDESFLASREFTAEYREGIEHVKSFALKNRTPTSSKKIYYLHGARQMGEEHLAEYFRSKGYEVVRPELLSLDEQLNILINCESFAAPVGSTSHNSIFLRDGTETILIPRLTIPSNSYQFACNQLNSADVYYVNSTLSLFSSGYYKIFYIISPQLKRFFGDKWDGYTEEDFKNFLQYVKDCTARGHVVNPKAMDYYAPILADFMSQLKQRQDLIAAYDMPLHWETFQPSLTYQTHVAKKGWSAWLVENQISNDIEKQLRIEAIKINLPNHKVYYAVYYNDKEGWSEEVTNSEPAGTTGKAKPIMGIRIRLDEEGAKEFDILYRVHKFDGTWTDWSKNGEVIYSHGQELNAIQIKLNLK